MLSESSQPYTQEKTQKGQHIDLSLLDVQISLSTYMATMQTLSGMILNQLEMLTLFMYLTTVLQLVTVLL